MLPVTEYTMGMAHLKMLPLSHCLCFVSLDKWTEARMLMKFWKAVKD
jgi:hypothetical protein